MNNRKRLDLNSPEAQTLRKEVSDGTFVTEGTMVAFPLCFPGASAPIASDESRITALDVTPEGIVYGGTSGKRTHLFVGMFHTITGIVFDLGAIEGADRCAAICCGKEKFIACVNGPRGGRLFTRRLQPAAGDLLQEWGFTREPLTEIGEAVKGEKILHAVADASKSLVIGVTERHVFTVSFQNARVEIVGEVTGAGRLAVGSKGGIFGMDDGDTLWRLDPETKALARKLIPLPPGRWQPPLIWAKDPADGGLYVADADGRLFSFAEERALSGPLAQTMIAPVRAMAVTPDGRVFGACGDGIGKLFCYSPDTRKVTSIGVAVSVIERRRYGYEFGDAVTGRDGQIILGEDDDLGHLWLYFPRILSRAASGTRTPEAR